MAVSDVQQAQRELEPREDLGEYAGQWVALRNGRVVASALDPLVLKEDPSVLPGDVIVPVSTADDGYFL